MVDYSCLVYTLRLAEQFDRWLVVFKPRRQIPNPLHTIAI
jgi:hypothetical protein